MKDRKSAILSSDDRVASLLDGVLVQAGYDRPQRSKNLAVAELGAYAPDVLMIDFDHLRGDRLESVRQLRFVLPDCTIAVVSSTLEMSWAAQCHLAGANGVFSGVHIGGRMLAGLRRAVRAGCYTDPSFSPRPSTNDIW